jgi:hypothetical protein
MRQMGSTALLVIGAVIVTGANCGGGSSPAPPAGPTPGVLQVAGQYQIVQQAVETSCGDTAAPPTVTGTVTQAPGAASFVLADTGGTTFTGTVQTTGEFTATATFGPDSAGQTYAQRLEGRFSATGFTGRLGVDVSPRACRFTRDWTGTKQGAPNVLP